MHLFHIIKTRSVNPSTSSGRTWLENPTKTERAFTVELVEGLIERRKKILYLINRVIAYYTVLFHTASENQKVLQLPYQNKDLFVAFLALVVPSFFVYCQ